jgi:hypothetical protein
LSSNFLYNYAFRSQIHANIPIAHRNEPYDAVIDEGQHDMVEDQTYHYVKFLSNNERLASSIVVQGVSIMDRRLGKVPPYP